MGAAQTQQVCGPEERAAEERSGWSGKEEEEEGRDRGERGRMSGCVGEENEEENW